MTFAGGLKGCHVESRPRSFDKQNSPVKPPLANFDLNLVLSNQVYVRCDLKERRKVVKLNSGLDFDMLLEVYLVAEPLPNIN